MDKSFIAKIKSLTKISGLNYPDQFTQKKEFDMDKLEMIQKEKLAKKDLQIDKQAELKN